MIDLIYAHDKLSLIVEKDIEECGIKVELDGSVLNFEGVPDPSFSVVLKPDGYYNSRVMHEPPKSVDNVTIIDNSPSGYDFYVIELRSSYRPRNIKVSEVKQKFDTMFQRFFPVDFADVFSGDFSVRRLNLWVVCFPYKDRGAKISREDFERRVKSSALDVFNSYRPYVLKNKVALIKPMLSPPTIHRDTFTEV
ncbi:hypothetical protein [Salinicola endophyticus]|uniref:Uncharacterized protein n=1 Tax=Salinicola endophyticus TaxID=1949083 RepID=A0AB74UFE8_9GAMM